MIRYLPSINKVHLFLQCADDILKKSEERQTVQLTVYQDIDIALWTCFTSAIGPKQDGTFDSIPSENRFVFTVCSQCLAPV